MAWIAPKLDWNSADSINADDWNRIENNTAEVVIYLNSIQYAMPALTTITNRTQAHVDYLSSINRIEQNIEAIKNAFMTPVGYPGSSAWVSGKPFTADDATRLELNLQLLLDTGVLVYESLRYCGATTCGEGWTV